MKLDQDIFGSADAGQLDPEIFKKVKPLQVAQSAPPQAYVPDEGIIQSALIGTGRTFDRLGAGMQQLYYGATGNDARLAEIKADQEEKTKLYQPLKNARPWATGIGEALPAMAVPMGGAATSLGSLAGRMALGNAALGGMEYGDAEERARNAALQGIGGGLGAVAGKALGSGAARLLNLQPVRGAATAAQKAWAAVLDNAGVPMSIGERTASRVARGMEDAFSVIPATAGKAQAAKAAQQTALNQAAARLAGVNNPVASITPDIADAARQGAGRAIGDIAERNALAVNSPVMKGLIELKNETERFAAPEIAKTVGARIDQALAKIETDAAGNLAIPGRTYRELQSAIGKQMKSANGDLKGYLGALRDTLRDGMNSSISQADKIAWEKANKTYRNAIALQDVAARSPVGDISPAALFQAGKKGTPEMRDLGAAASAMIKPLPSSGTAERSFAINMITNPLAAVTQGVAALPAMAAQKMLNKAGQHPNGLAQIPEWMLNTPGVLGGYGGGLLGSAYPYMAYPK